MDRRRARARSPIALRNPCDETQNLIERTMEPPAIIDGFKCFAPDVASLRPDFPKEEFDRLYELEAGSFWFRGRQRLIEYLVERFLPNTKSSFLEIGCGTGFVLQG